MNPQEIIKFCATGGVSLDVNGDWIGYQPASKLTPEMRRLIVAHKPALLAELTPKHAADPEAQAERAAIQSLEREADELNRFANLLAVGVGLLERCPVGTVLYRDGRVVFPQ